MWPPTISSTYELTYIHTYNVLHVFKTSGVGTGGADPPPPPPNILSMGGPGPSNVGACKDIRGSQLFLLYALKSMCTHMYIIRKICHPSPQYQTSSYSTANMHTHVMDMYIYNTSVHILYPCIVYVYVYTCIQWSPLMWALLKPKERLKCCEFYPPGIYCCLLYWET